VRPSPGASPNGADLLRTAAAAARHWALQGTSADAERLDAEAGLLRRASIVVGATLVLSGIAIVFAAAPGVKVLPLATAAALAYVVLRIRRAETQAAEARAEADAILTRLLADHGLPPAARADLLPWPELLARHGIAQVPPDRVDDAVDELRRRTTRTSRRAPARPPVPPPSEGVDSPEGAQHEETASSSKPATDETEVPTEALDDGPEDGGSSESVERVVVLDDGLHVGHRIALRDLSEKLSAHVPVLVLTTNERLWLPPRRTG
jgi:hypothetical protein